MLRLPRRRWVVLRTHTPDGERFDPPIELDRCWTETGAWRARSYWWEAQRLVGYKSVLQVKRLP